MVKKIFRTLPDKEIVILKRLKEDVNDNRNKNQSDDDALYQIKMGVSEKV